MKVVIANWRTCWKGLALLLGLSVVALPVRAHPHAWIDVWVTLHFDGAGLVTGLEQTWLFDEFYSAFATEGLDKDGDGTPDPEQLRELLKLNLNNLKDYDYFTRIESGGLPVALSGVTTSSSRMEGYRLRMTFDLDLAEPISLAEAPLSYAIFDPTYYIEVLHARSDDAIELGNAPAGCTFELKDADPEPDATLRASALDRSQSGGIGLGILFAQWVTVRCAP